MNYQPFSQPDALTESVAETLIKSELLEAVAIVDDDSLTTAVLKILPNADVTKFTGYVSWHKSGGYAGEKMIDRIKEKLMAIGFKKDSVKGGNTPDGSSVFFGDRLVNKKLGWEALLSKKYGSTASSNSYTATIQKIKTT